MQKVRAMFLKTILFIAISQMAVGSDLAFDKLKHVDETLYWLQKVADIFPPSIGSEERRVQVTSRWREAEPTVRELLQANRRDYSLLVRAGDFYRMGHNLDIDGCEENATKYLKFAISVRPNVPMAHILLGMHYTFSRKPADGEKEFQVAIAKECNDEEKAQIYRGLAYAYYFQLNFNKSKEYADKYLSYYPSDKTVKFVRDRADEAIRGVIKTKIVEMK